VAHPWLAGEYDRIWRELRARFTPAKGEASRPFPLATVLSLTTGRLLAEVNEMFELVEWLIGPQHRHITQVDIARLQPDCRIGLIVQHRWLQDVEAPAFATPLELFPWLATVTAEHGDDLTVRPLPPGAVALSSQQEHDDYIRRLGGNPVPLSLDDLNDSDSAG
jgi:hypothetical protein